MRLHRLFAISQVTVVKIMFLCSMRDREFRKNRYCFWLKFLRNTIRFAQINVAYIWISDESDVELVVLALVNAAYIWISEALDAELVVLALVNAAFRFV